MFCAALSPRFGAAAEQPVLAQEYSGADGRAIFWWTRRQDEYTLQFFTGVVSPKTRDHCDGLKVQPPPGMNHESFFIGSTIACLRGLDPTFGARTLTLIDGRRATRPPGEAIPAQPANPVQTEPASPPPPPPAPPPAADIQVWVLHKDGSIILPQRKSPVDPDGKYCGYGRCESGFVYGFDLSVGRNAVAVAYKMGDDVHIQKLEVFADEQD
jgi:hypothetical protein